MAATFIVFYKVCSGLSVVSSLCCETVEQQVLSWSSRYFTTVLAMLSL